MTLVTHGKKWPSWGSNPRHYRLSFWGAAKFEEDDFCKCSVFYWKSFQLVLAFLEIYHIFVAMCSKQSAADLLHVETDYTLI